MEVQVAETGPCSRTLTITVPPEAVKQHVDQLYASAQQQVQMKGFRRGKVPRQMLERMHGAQILAEAKEQLLNRFFGEACRERQLNPVGRIRIDDLEKVEVKVGEALAFTAQIDVKPQFELPDAKGIEVPAFEPEATDEDIDGALKEIAHQKRTIKPTTEPVADGDFVKCDYTFADEGGAEVHTRKGVQLNTRIPIHGVDDAAYTEALLGAKAGDTREMPIAFPDNFEKPAVRGKQGTVRVHVREVLRVSPPPIDDALAKGMEFESLDDLRADLKQRISAEKQRIGRQRQEDHCLDHLAKATGIPLPPSLVEEQKQASLQGFAQRLQQEGLAEEEIHKRLDEAAGEAQQDAERRVKLFFLIEAVARQQKLFVTEGDIEGELRRIAAANSGPEQQITAAQVREHLDRENRLGELRLALLERKVREFLRENSKSVDKTGG